MTDERLHVTLLVLIGVQTDKRAVLLPQSKRLSHASPSLSLSLSLPIYLYRSLSLSTCHPSSLFVFPSFSLALLYSRFRPPAYLISSSWFQQFLLRFFRAVLHQMCRYSCTFIIPHCLNTLCIMYRCIH